MGSSSTNKKLNGWKDQLSLARSQLSFQLIKDFFTLPSDTLDTLSLKTTLERCILIRVVILSYFLIVSGWTSLLHDGSSFGYTTYAIIGLTYALSLINAYLLRKPQNITRFAYSQLMLDVFLASISAYVASPFTVILLYLFVILAAAFLIGRHAAVIVASASGLAYSLVVSELFLPRPAHLASATTADIIEVYTALVIVALLGSYLAKRVELARSALAQQELSFSEYHEQQQQLVDGLSEGVITLDLESTITGINEAARAIMGLAELQASQLVGKTFEDVFSNSDATELISAFNQSTQSEIVSSEATLKRVDTNSDIQVSYNVSALNDRFGNTSGQMLRFSDVSDYHNIKEQLNLHERMTELLAETQPDTNYSNNSGVPREIIGASFAMQEVFELVDKVSPSDASVLIFGESGTGKELIARSIHYRSSRKNKKLVAINCGAIPENLLESEFFGHAKGAFTGAVAEKKGLFQEAEGGTLFLDEVGELPSHLQTKLLRALQERVIRPVGDTRDIPINVRVVAATNKKLKEEIKTGSFREDLYYRLNVLTINLPPLRKRREDIPLLVKHFMQTACRGDETAVVQVSPEALKLLVQYNFPGNIRELENIIARAVVLGGSAILPSHLPEELHSEQNQAANMHETNRSAAAHDSDLSLPLDLDSELAELERRLLMLALDSSNGVKKKAANLLGLNFRSFRYRLKKYGLQDIENDL